MDLNAAGVAELVRLPGVGPVLAERIVAERRGPRPLRLGGGAGARAGPGARARSGARGSGPRAMSARGAPPGAWARRSSRSRALALGSWRTFERIPREPALAVMRAAREAGIDFLDDARYDDETGSAPIPTGYSEVLFGELFRPRAGRATRSSSPTSCGGSSGPSRRAAAGARRVARAHGLRPRRPHLPDAAARRARRWPRRWARSPRWSTSGKARAWGVGTGRPRRLAEAARARRRARRAAAVRGAAALQPRARDWVESDGDGGGARGLAAPASWPRTCWRAAR